jgi:hypothetical protein
MIGQKLVIRILLGLSILPATALFFPQSSLASIVYGEQNLEEVTILTYFRNPDVYTAVPANASLSFSVQCPQDFDRHVMSGGIDSQSTTAEGFNIVDSYPTSDTTWFIRVYNDTSAAQNVRPYIVCGS